MNGAETDARSNDAAGKPVRRLWFVLLTLFGLPAAAVYFLLSVAVVAHYSELISVAVQSHNESWLHSQFVALWVAAAVLVFFVAMAPLGALRARPLQRWGAGFCWLALVVFLVGYANWRWLCMLLITVMLAGANPGTDLIAH